MPTVPALVLVLDRKAAGTRLRTRRIRTSLPPPERPRRPGLLSLVDSWR